MEEKKLMSYKKLKIALRKIKWTMIVRFWLSKEDKFKDWVSLNDRQDDFMYPRMNDLWFERKYDLQIVMGENYWLNYTNALKEQREKMWYYSFDVSDICIKIRRYGKYLWNDTYEIISNPNIKW